MYHSSKKGFNSMEIMCFYVGIAFFYYKSMYLISFLLCVLFFRPRLHYILYFIFAIQWGWLHQWLTLDEHMPQRQIIKQATIEGYVASVPFINSSKTQFQFKLYKLDRQSVSATILLSCYAQCPRVRAGEYWQLQAKLVKPHNLQNPGGFDYVNWLNTRHIQWTGRIVKHSGHLIDKPKKYPILQLREKLAENILSLSFNEKQVGIIEALTLGLTHYMEKSEWQLFRQTGTIHLMVISGAHIGLVAGMVFYLFKICWSFLGLGLRYPAQKAASIAGIIAAVLYTLIAGFSVPAQRALVVCILLFGRNLMGLRYTSWQAWRYALFLVLLIEPHSVSLSGFYLSFSAVAILIILNQRFKQKGFKKNLILQLGCLLGLMPLTLYWFAYGAVNGLIANLVAIPWVSFLIVPPALLLCLTAPFFIIPGLVPTLKLAIALFLSYLQTVSRLSLINFVYTLPHVTSVIVLMLIGGIITLLPIKKWLPILITLFSASIIPYRSSLSYGSAQVDVLDVGQGLAVIVRTAKHTLIYDTGMKKFQGADMGEMVIIPYLNFLNVRNVDKIVISHPDLDHRGGLPALEANYSNFDLIVNDPDFYKKGASCTQYKSWYWEGVKFSFLPIQEKLKGKNNNSCILKIATPGGSVLLTGDIEKEGEYYLAENYSHELPANVLVVPHHGSKTSSTPAFLSAVSPNFGVFSYGFDNRYHFPHQQVIKNYQDARIKTFSTSDVGMISIQLKPNDYSVTQKKSLAIY
jgi:competence protein ComEC